MAHRGGSWWLPPPLQAKMIVVVVCCSVFLAVHGDMTREEKQTLLDLHNYYRATEGASNMRRLSWSESLENAAQDVADSCNPSKERGMNFYFNTSKLSNNSLKVADQILQDWLSSSGVQQPITWHRTSAVGCAVTQCGRLPFDDGTKVINTKFVVCKYTPSYFSSPDGSLYRPGRCTSTSCPSEAKMCVAYTGTVRPTGAKDTTSSYCGLSSVNPLVPEDDEQPTVRREITYITPRDGSLAGGTTITVRGVGFSSNQFDGGNRVTLVASTGNVTCDVISYSSSQGKIECVTREAPDQTKDTTYSVHVSSNDGSGDVYIPPCSNCQFNYRFYWWTPTIENVFPLSAPSHTPVTLSGELYSAGFDDPNDPEDLTSTDREDNRRDYFTRILVGGRGCNHMKEDGSLYSSTIDENGIYATVQCMPTLGNMIDSHNVTVVLGKRGNAYVRPTYNLISLDNKLRPYHFQTHADIVDVSPRNGSVGGGTRITIMMNHTLIDYKDDVVVNVGGVPCKNVTVLPSEDARSYGVIECITGPRPPQTTYYPGGRGVIREVFSGSSNFNQLENLPRSTQYTTHDRFYLTSNILGDMYNFRQRVSGFFVPPKSSLYTFNLLSDDLSRLYVSPNMSKEHLTRIITVYRYTSRRWDRFTYQESDPMYLEKDKPYYFEAFGNQGGGPWDIGLGVKLHNSTLSGGLYDSQKERQRITITSAMTREQHLVELEARPHVQRITLRPVVSAQNGENTNITCLVTLNVSRDNNVQDGITVSPFISAKLLENLLNGLSVISNIGRVSVTKNGHNGSVDMFWTEVNAVLELTIVFVTNFEVSRDEIPEIVVTSGPSCSSTEAELGVTVTSNVTQNLTYPPSFEVGFNANLGNGRFISPLPLNASAEALQEELTNLLSWGCTEEEGIGAKTERYDTFESPGQGRIRDNATSFCGFYSSRDPHGVWRESNDGTYRLTAVPYICFAYRGSFPGLYVTFNYRKLEKSNDGVNTLVSESSTTRRLHSGVCSNWPFTGEVSTFDGWTNYGCVNVRECVNELLPSTDTITYDRHTITGVGFYHRSTFYIDNLAFARSNLQISRVPSLAPVIPNGVIINYIEVDGGVVSDPAVTTRSIESDNGTKLEYVMTVSTFRVTYDVKDCGFGMGLLRSRYGSSEGVRVSQVQEASMPVSGHFDITMGNVTLENVNATITSSSMEQLFNIAFKDEGAFDVSRSGSCTGYRWTVSWLDALGDRPQMSVAGDRLSGVQADIRVEILDDGGVWIRPLRGDMLRIPEAEPQVEVIINQIPSTCTSGNCSFFYDDNRTPFIFSVTPSEGQSGTMVTIFGNDFSDFMDEVEVTIGQSPCEVIYANESMIQCIAGFQSAGCYAVGVSIDGMGVASTETSACFRYLLTLYSISPSVGGVSGGHIITLSGEGFFEFVQNDREREGPLAFLPWFRYGLGMPAVGSLEDMNYCPSFYDTLQENFTSNSFTNASTMLSDDFNMGSLEDHVRERYFDSPLQVFVGETPCIIVEATVTNISCIPLTSSLGSVNVTVSVSVFDQTDMLNNSYSISSDNTVIVQSINPSSGPVVGNISLLLTGRLFDSTSGANGVEVMVGRRPCAVQFFNDTHILCRTPRLNAGPVPVFVSAASGVAVLQSALSNWSEVQSVSSLFPTFMYELQIRNATFSRGSVFGGTEVSVTGGIFVPGETTVFVGEEDAQIMSVTDSEVVFLTPSSSRTQSLFLSAQLVNTILNTVVFSFSWDRRELTIPVGDSITWNWELNLNVDQRLELNIYEIEPFQSDLDQTVVKQNGFSNVGSPSSSFRITFNEVGTYYFATRNNLNTETLVSLVNVTEPQFMRRGVEVYVGGFLATYEEPSSGNTGSPSSSRKRREAPCVEEVMTSPSNTAALTFDYSPCLTPTILSVTPRIGTRKGTIFTIQGEQFSMRVESSIVTIGGYPCITLSSSPNSITCAISNDTSVQPPSYTPLLVSVRNSDPGYGNAFVSNHTASTVILLPLVSEVSPSEGSLAGGTDIVIFGDTLDFTEDLVIRLGSGWCSIRSVQYYRIECKTSSNGMEDGEIRFHRNSEELEYFCDSCNCTFSYSDAYTPRVQQVLPASLNGPGSHTIELIGQGFSNIYDQYNVTLNDAICNITSANSTYIICNVSPLSAGSYSIGLSICNLTGDGSRCFGYGLIENDARNVRVIAGVAGVTPEQGSVHGETEIIVSGFGFSGVSSLISVTLNSTICDVTSASLEEIVCITSAHQQGIVSIAVTDGGSSVITGGGAMFEFSSASTPVVTSITPSKGTNGDLMTVAGMMFGNSSSLVLVRVGGEPCEVQVVNDSSLTCRLGPNFVGRYPVEVMVTGLGSADVGVEFTYTLVITSISNTSGSMAGQNVLQIEGSGFDPSDTSITICGRICSPTATIPTVTTTECIVPSFIDAFVSMPGRTEVPCPVVVESVQDSVNHSEVYVYRRSLTPTVDFINDTRGGTEGGTPILIRGSGFTGAASVTIANSECVVMSQNETEITCQTNRSGRTVRTKVMVWIEGKGFAVSSIEFWYVDLWSSRFTWGGESLPREGDFVVIPRGQTLVLDTKTPVLAYLLIQGGELIFDRDKGDNEVELHTQGALITSGGRLEVGTEDDPFLSKTQIVLYGNVLSTEIPVYGAKTLALRMGEIDMHGRPLDVTWTRLAKTAKPGEMEIHLQDTVDWDVGGKVVIASTSFSQRENEEMEIAAIRQGNVGSILTLTTSLSYEHISVEQTVDGRRLETRGEVGYLTRNILIRGNRNEEWDEEVEDCPDEFRPGQFEVQTCFQGRFGREVVGDQFGSQIMIHAAEQNQGHVKAQFGYIEFTHAGQAFRLGRYPIHFHLNGNVSGSYVRGCGIHHTFNRAVTIHAVDHLLVEKNVAYNILGHAYFLEDGIEQYNIIQDNLGVFVRASSSLLNVDITPATFWMVNANNYIRRNAAAGGTHFGFWYRLPKNPTGPSFTTSLCPRKQRVLQFENNTAHSFGWYGLWVFRHYSPSLNGGCGDTDHAPSHFDRFFSWRNDKGVEFSEVGALQLRDSVMLDNTLAGVEVTEVESIWNEENGPLISNTLIVGHSEISPDGFCTESGIKTPKSYYLTVSGVTFANFNRSSCYPITACSFCRVKQGGFETRYKNIRYVNAGDKLTKWQWEHEHIHRDLDGTLTDSNSPKLLIPTNGLLDPSHCSDHPESGITNGMKGSICDGELDFGRIAVYRPTPSTLEFVSLNVTNEHGKNILPYVFKRLRGTGPARMAHLQLNQTYQFAWQDGETFTNISYSTLISGFSENDYVILKQEYPMPLDIVEIAGITTATNASVLNDAATARTGDYYVEDDNVTLNYIIKGGVFPLNEKTNFFQTIRCQYLNCIPPPPPTLPPPISPGRPSDAVMWSNTSIWPNNTLPSDGQNVTISRDVYIIADVITLPRLDTLIIAGGLELLDNQDRVLEANVIIIDGGRLVAGYPDTPFRHGVRIILHGNVMSPLYRHGPERAMVGSKAIGVFGELILHGEMANPKSWTLLESTATAGSSQITLTESVDWDVGDSIVITSTSFDAYQTEVFQIIAISNRVLTLNDTLSHTHLGIDESVGSVSYSIRAEVGHLSRKIVIENGEPDRAVEDAFGCRVFVSSSGDYRGTVQLEGVEFNGCGQLGLSDSSDPRFALAILNTGRQTDSYVRDCSFHDGYNTAIGMFGTDNMVFTNNVIHSTVGPSMLVTGTDHTVINNLASLSQFIGTYRQRNEPLNSLWTANFMIVDAQGITFTHNHAAGGAKSGVHTDGEDCMGSTSTIRHNVAHSSLHCFHVGYSDGSSTGCSRFDNITAYACNHYGFFSYSRAGVQLYDSTFVNNKAAVYVSVIGPGSLSHQIGMKTVQIERTKIVSASRDFNCEQDNIVPDIAIHPRSHSPGLRTPSKGHVGIFVPSFLSGSGLFPHFAWTSIHTYPTIGGMTYINQVSFTNFGERCGNEKDAAIITSKNSEDANHPVHLERISFESDGRFTSGDVGINPGYKLLVHEPNINRVNPSDCVDMDCDGMKHVLLRDIDGSFTETGSLHTIVSKAEFEWNGDRRRGIGDYRIPKTMLSKADGSRIDVNDIYPAKGIVRGNSFAGSDCNFNENWNMYLCANLDHLMLVLESLDDDTEVRRLSPIGIGANGFIDLLNGPMDNGWCGGYTCQERISTFYGIVASSFNYTVGLTSTNPQNFALHLLNSNDQQGIVIRIIYTNPQRLDIYENNNGEDVYVPPKNARVLDDGNLEYSSDLPDDQYFPVMSDPHGANFYDRSLKQLHINIKGNRTYKIITTPVIMLSVTLSVTTEEFFAEEFLVRNLALLLNIPANRIRIVNVVRETTQSRRRRRRRQAGGIMETIELEIGDPPSLVIETEVPMSNTTYGANTTMNATNTANTTNATSTFSFEQLTELTEMVAVVVQTGEILKGSNGTSLVAAEVEEPVPAPVDPTGGVRATPNTGGLQPDDVGDNDTVLTFYEQQLVDESARANNSAPVVQLSIPSSLVISKKLTGTAVEGLPLSREEAPIFTMYDNNGRVSETLGIGMPWKLTATMTKGPQDGFLTNHIVTFVRGNASFEGVVFSHPGTYSLTFTVSFPENANFSIPLEPIVVSKRSLSLTVHEQPQDGNTTFVLYPYPVIRLIDEKGGHLQEHTWRNSTWYILASLEKNRGQKWRAELKRGEAVFKDVKITDPGVHNLVFRALTDPKTSSENLLPAEITSRNFRINKPQFTRFIVTYDADYNLVINGSESEFIEAFEKTFTTRYPAAELYGTNVTKGSIIVSTFVTARTTQQLVDIINLLSSEGNHTLILTFGGETLMPSSVVQDPSYPVRLEDHLVLILATTIPGGLIILCSCFLICVVVICQRRRKVKSGFKIQVASGYMSNLYDSPRTAKDDQGSLVEFYLKNQNEIDDNTEATPRSQQKLEVVTSMGAIEVPGSFYANPEAMLETSEKEDLSKQD